jgi:spore coat protein U-like protein
MKQTLLAITGLVLVTGLSSPAIAATYTNGTASANFDVSLLLQANCAIAASPLNFGTSGLLSSAVNQETSVDVTCTNTTPYNVGLDAGTVAGSTVANRLMAGTAADNSATTVDFQLYQDAGRTTVWGNTQDTDTLGNVGTGIAQSIPVYGQVPAQDTPQPGSYQTTVTATVYF